MAEKIRPIIPKIMTKTMIGSMRSVSVSVRLDRAVLTEAPVSISVSWETGPRARAKAPTMDRAVRIATSLRFIVLPPESHSTHNQAHDTENYHKDNNRLDEIG